MFNRRVVILTLTLLVCVGFMIGKWNISPSVNLYTVSTHASSERFEIDLTGEWNIHQTLRQALVKEEGKKEQIPSSLGIHVATKEFRLPSEWSARATVLQFVGIKGQVDVYLNGIEGKDRIGNFTSEGSIERIFIPSNFLRYGQDNEIFLVFSAPSSQEQTLFGLKYPNKGKATGSIILQGVRETSIEDPQIKVRWDKANALVQVDFQLIHRGFSDDGPWDVYGVISDGSAEVAAASSLVKHDENSVHAVSLNFTIPNARKWSVNDPYLYQLYLTATNPKGDKDGLAIPLGIKSLAFKNGVFIENGKALAVKGLAVSPEEERKVRSSSEIREWLKKQKESGFNLLYFLGEFPDEIWFAEADKIGIGIWANLPGTSMVPVGKLSPPEIWQNLIRSGSLHPSLWAYNAGTGLELHSESVIKDYWKKVHALTTPAPAFTIRLTDGINLPTEYSPRYTGEKIEGVWGTIDFPLDKIQEEKGWPGSEKLSVIWAAIVCVVTWINIGTRNWRYKELSNPKPKRDLRRAWFWQWPALLSRELTVAGMITTLIMNQKVPWHGLIPGQWPLWSSLKLQSPILIWLILGMFFTLMRLLQVGVAAPHMPEKPAPLGLALWLERRYSWTWFIAILWALLIWGVPSYVPVLLYFLLIVLFLPLRVRDIRRVGGRYVSLLIVPGLLGGALLLLGIAYWSDFLYLGQLIYAWYF